MVQRSMTEILEAVYEQDFLDFSYGFRPGRSCHQALSVLDHTLMWQPVNYVIDADDFIICVRYRRDAEWIMRELKTRLHRCHLELSEEKTRLVRFGRYASKKWEEEKAKGNRKGINYKTGAFNFLGFTHYCTKSRSGKFKVGRKTERKRFTMSVKRIKVWLKSQRNKRKLREIWHRVGQMLMGHYRYYGVTENIRQLENFYDKVQRLLYKWLNRRSQKKSFTWEKFSKYLKSHPLPRPKIYHSLPQYARYYGVKQ